MAREWVDKTCEDCEFAVNDRCRHHIGDYGYRQIASHGKYVMACSFWSKIDATESSDGVAGSKLCGLPLVQSKGDTKNSSLPS